MDLDGEQIPAIRAKMLTEVIAAKESPTEHICSKRDSRLSDIYPRPCVKLHQKVIQNKYT